MIFGMVLEDFLLCTLNCFHLGLGAVPAALPSLADRAAPSGDKFVDARKNGDRVSNVPQP